MTKTGLIFYVFLGVLLDTRARELSSQGSLRGGCGFAKMVKIGSRFSPKSKIEPKSPFWSLWGPFVEPFYEILVIYLDIFIRLLDPKFWSKPKERQD